MLNKDDLKKLKAKAKARVYEWENNKFVYEEKPTNHLVFHTRGYLEALADIEDILEIKEELDGSL